jgi:hypothetical protein
MNDNLTKHIANPDDYVPITQPQPVADPHPVPTPPIEGYAPNPSLRLNWPGLSLPDSLRQAYGNGVKVRRFFPLSNS